MSPFYYGVLAGFSCTHVAKLIRDPSAAMALAVAFTVAVYWGILRVLCAIERRLVRS